MGSLSESADVKFVQLAQKNVQLYKNLRGILDAFNKFSAQPGCQCRRIRRGKARAAGTFTDSDARETW